MSGLDARIKDPIATFVTLCVCMFATSLYLPHKLIQRTQSVCTTIEQCIYTHMYNVAHTGTMHPVLSVLLEGDSLLQASLQLDAFGVLATPRNTRTYMYNIYNCTRGQQYGQSTIFTQTCNCTCIQLKK